jgi:hypothetical protein
VPAFAGVALATEICLSRNLNDPSDEVRLSSSNLSQICEKILGYNEPTFFAKCDNYLNAVGFEDLSANLLPLYINNSITYLRSILAFERGMVEDTLRTLTGRVEQFLSTPNDENISQYRSSIRGLFYAFKSLSEGFVRGNKGTITAAMLAKWWSAALSYIKLLKRAVKEAKEQTPSDPYLVAIYTQLLLQAMLSGISKTVTYQEMKEITDEMETAAEQSFVYAPPMWKIEAAVDLQILYTNVIPFLHQKQYQGIATIDAFSPEFLEFYVPESVAKVRFELFGNLEDFA